MSFDKKSADKNILTTKQILEAHKAHGDDFIVINFKSIRKYKDFSQYLDIDIRLADGTVTGVRYWKLSNDGIIVSSRIRPPEQRKYESIRMGTALKDDETKEENENVKALQLLCIAFEKKMKQLKDSGEITDDDRAPRKQPDGTMRPFYLISTKVVTPMQTTAHDSKNDDIIELDNPRFWISIPKKRFYKNGEVQRESMHFEDKYYSGDNGQPDMNKPVMTHEYAPDFYNVDDSYHHSRTGKKIYKHLGDSSGDVNLLNNTNIQNYLTRGSALMGNLKFELAVSGRQCKFEVMLHGRIYVKVAEVVEGGLNQEDHENIDMFSNRYASIGGKVEGSDGTDEDTEDEFVNM